MLTFHVTSIFSILILSPSLSFYLSLSHIVSLTLPLLNIYILKVFHSCVNFGTVRKAYVRRTDFVSLCKWESNIYMYIVIFFQFIIIIFTFRFFFNIIFNRNIYFKKNGLLNVLDILRSVTNHSNMYIYLEN